MKSRIPFLTLIAILIAFSDSGHAQFSEYKTYELRGLPPKLGIWDLESKANTIDLKSRLEEFGMVFETGDFCFWIPDSRTVFIQTNSDNLELFEGIIKAMYATDSVREMTIAMLARIEELEGEERIDFLENQGFFPDRFVDALAQECKTARLTAHETELKRLREKLVKALDRAIPYLKSQIELTSE